MFIGFAIDAKLCKHSTELTGVSGQQVNAGDCAIGGTTQGFTVNGDFGNSVRGLSMSDPPSEGCLELPRIETS
jgi:hypothetical protein